MSVCQFFTHAIFNDEFNEQEILTLMKWKKLAWN